MGIEKITEKIVFDANEAARRENVKAKYDSREFLRKARCLRDDLIEDAEKRAEIDGDLLHDRRKSVGQLEARKLRLAVKQEAVSRCFAQAVETLSKLPQEEYLSFLVRTVAELNVQRGEIMLNKRDQAAIGETLVALMNTDGKEFTLSQQTIDSQGGFVLKEGAIFLNSTLETMVEAVKEELTTEVVQTLFS